MPNPCAGVPANPWCPAGHSKGYTMAAKPLLGGLGAPWPYGGIVALLAVGSIGWRRLHPKGRHART
jgi:hypothetical protein